MDTRKVFRALGIPTDTEWSATGASPATIEQAKMAVQRAPEKGTILISGIATPFLAEAYAIGKQVAAIDYLEYFDSKFKDLDDQLGLPPARKGQFTMIYNINKEPVKDYGYSSKLLQGLITKYSGGIVILQTEMTKNSFNIAYGMSVVNSLIIRRKKEEEWV